MVYSVISIMCMFHNLVRFLKKIKNFFVYLKFTFLLYLVFSQKTSHEIVK